MRRGDVSWSETRFGELREMRVPSVPSGSDHSEIPVHFGTTINIVYICEKQELSVLVGKAVRI